MLNEVKYEVFGLQSRGQRVSNVQIKHLEEGESQSTVGVNSEGRWRAVAGPVLGSESLV